MLSLNRQQLENVFVSRVTMLILSLGIFMDVPNTTDQPIDNTGQSPSGGRIQVGPAAGIELACHLQLGLSLFRCRTLSAGYAWIRYEVLQLVLVVGKANSLA